MSGVTTAIEPEEQARRATSFRDLHSPGRPLVIPNPWDVGSARLLASLGFAALATTSGGFAATLGRRDGAVTRDEALAHAAALVGAVVVPVSADLENGFGESPDEVARTAVGARRAGLSGFSIEDATGRPDRPIFSLDHAVERVSAAAEQAHAPGQPRLVLTARAENHLHGRDDLSDTIARLRAFEAAGADVVFAPGLVAAEQIAAVVDAVGVPVSVLLLAGGPSVPELARLGVSRVSTGSAMAWSGYGAVVAAATELLDAGTTSWLGGAGTGAAAARTAFSETD